jgi:hypothetical protein
LFVLTTVSEVSVRGGPALLFLGRGEAEHRWERHGGIKLLPHGGQEAEVEGGWDKIQSPRTVPSDLLPPTRLCPKSFHHSFQ